MDFEGKNPFKKAYKKIKRKASQIQNVKTESNIEGELEGEKVEFIDCPTTTNLKTGRTYVNLDECKTMRKIQKEEPNTSY